MLVRISLFFFLIALPFQTSEANDSELTCFSGGEQGVLDYLEKGGDPNSIYSSGESCLMYAILIESNQAVRALLAHNADVHYVMPQTGQDALFTAIAIKNREIVQQLVDHGAKPDRLLRIEGWGHITALHLAVVVQDAEIVSFLLDKGVDPDIADGQFNRGRPLHIAVEVRNEKIIGLLLKRGASPDFHSGEYLRAALLRKCLPCLIALLDNGADVNAAESESGQTILHYAVSFDDPALLDLLIRYGADPHARDRSGRNALEIAISKGKMHSLKYLQERE
ncbi:MAG: hypothetical protein F9K24_00795 [Leptonema illini]|uniref:Ankyrin repeat domain-containing protein n=1 Tax=Leptonema illini TaxID=183 RepID=A0A833H4R1_9LEPT|nr:MAG: hypothetical protein F9K24_00795 [Leptonema illini]